MKFQVLDENLERLDAHLELEQHDVVVHSRGGTRGQPNLRNGDYGPGLKLILDRIQRAGLTIAAVWVDSGDVAGLPLESRRIFGPSDQLRTPAQQFTDLSRRMKQFGRPTTGPGGNSTKRIRLRLEPTLPVSELPGVLGLAAVGGKSSPPRLPVDKLSAVTAEHIWNAVERLLAGAQHPFGPSTDFDLVTEGGIRLAPKAVFGLAASEALGMPVGPRDFTGGVGTPSFRALQAAGFEIVEKGAPVLDADVVPGRDREWAEGSPKLRLHLKRERASGLSQAKKASFVRERGRLSCERCNLVPSEVYGSAAGDACIEVHHDRVGVAAMGPEHRTRLEDLQCLCANCHRVVHALIRQGSESTPGL